MHDKDFNINTPCKECVFAIFSGAEQIGCKQNRLEIYKHRNQTEEITEDNRQFYNITTVCNLFRTENWLLKNEGVDLLNKARQEAQIQVSAIVMLVDESQDVNKTLQSLLNQTMRPVEVILLSNTKMKYNELLNIVKCLDKKIPYLCIKIFDDTMNYLNCVDDAVRRIKKQFYLVIDAGEELNESAIYNCNKIYNDLVKPFSFAKGQNFKVFQRKLHEMVGGNKVVEFEGVILETLDEKIKYLATQQNNALAVINV